MVTTRSRRPSSQDSAAAAAASNGQTKTGDATSTDDRNPKKRQFEEPPPPNKQARQKTEQSNGNTNNTKQQQQQQQPRQGTTQSPTILERGTIYYFIRARVNIETPRQVSDIARGYLILRPIPASAGSSKDALADKAKSQSATTRLLALPKKLLPGSSQDRFMAFVEKADASYENLRDELLKGDEYETKTAGHRHRPDATPVGEGVYVISSTGRESHLSYMATVPKEMGELQRALRFNERGSFILSSKNPKAESPPNAQLPEGADYPPEIMGKFGPLRWAPTEPELLDYAQAQVLLIGDKTDLGKAVEEGKTEGGAAKKEAGEEDQEEGEGEDPVAVLQDLESQDVDRMKHLSENEADAIYEDLKSQALSHGDIQKEF